MIANVDAVTVFNGRLNRETRRMIFIPTVIRGVSCMEAKGSSVANNGVWSSDVQVKMRIPFSAAVQDSRQYLPCLRYAGLDDGEAAKYWTIRKEDLMIRGEYVGEQPLYEDEINTYAKEQGLDLIRITEYADNTAGGSRYTKHWRIGGK